MNGYNTNLAAEFYVLSVLHRLGADANLTLGNKKSVDIAVVRGAGDSLTVDVKGLAGKTGWPIDNFRGGRDAMTYYAPGGRKVITLSSARKTGLRFRDAWAQLL